MCPRQQLKPSSAARQTGFGMNDAGVQAGAFYRAVTIALLVHQHAGEPVGLCQCDQANDGGEEQAVLEGEAEQV